MSLIKLLINCSILLGNNLVESVLEFCRVIFFGADKHLHWLSSSFVEHGSRVINVCEGNLPFVVKSDGIEVERDISVCILLVTIEEEIKLFTTLTLWSIHDYGLIVRDMSPFILSGSIASFKSLDKALSSIFKSMKRLSSPVKWRQNPNLRFNTAYCCLIINAKISLLRSRILS